MKQFDKTNTGKIKIYHLINLLKFKVKGFSEDTLKAIQFDLECLSNDGMIDYEEFVSIAFKNPREKQVEDVKQQGSMSERQRIWTRYMIEDYNEILIKIL